jgi:type 1 glutamine amidotransferase
MPVPSPQDALRILVFTQRESGPNPVLSAASTALQNLSAKQNWDLRITAQTSEFTQSRLENYAAVVWLNTSGTVLDPAQRSAYEHYHRSGRGSIAIHSGGVDTEKDWSWYRKLASATAVSGWGRREFTIVNLDAAHPATFAWPMIRRRTAEWFRFAPGPHPSPDARVLLVIDDPVFPLGVCYPVSWCSDCEQGRYFYTAFGGTPEDYSDEIFLTHLARGIEWAAGKLPGHVTRANDGAALILREFDGSPNGTWDKQAPSPDFTYEVTAEALHLHDSTAISLENRHVVRRGVAIDPTRPYAIEGQFTIPGPIDPHKHYSFCVNVNVAGTDGDLSAVSTWAVPAHVLGNATSLTRIMGFHHGSFFMIGELRNRWGDADRGYSFCIHVNADLDGLPQAGMVSRTLQEGATVLEQFQADFSALPYQPDLRQPVRLGFNSHGASWILKDLKVYYLDVMQDISRTAAPMSSIRT